MQRGVFSENFDAIFRFVYIIMENTKGLITAKAYLSLINEAISTGSREKIEKK